MTGLDELTGRSVAVFGLGEAGSEIAADLAGLGARVIGHDPAAVPTPPGVTRVDDPLDAVRGAELVLGITAGADARAAFDQGLGGYASGATYADLATSSPAAKRALADAAAQAGMAFADVALMSTVPGTGARTPQLVAGTGAASYATTMAAAGALVEVVSDAAGAAATRKLLRSVAMKGVAAVVIEAMRAATAAGLAAETWRNLADQFSALDEDFLRRLVRGTDLHALRRTHEMEVVCDLLAELHVEPVLSSATLAALRAVPEAGVPELPE